MDAVRGGLDSVVLVAPRCFSMSVGGGARGGLGFAARPTPAREQPRAQHRKRTPMQVACGPSRLLRRCRARTSRPPRRPAGGLLPARRAVPRPARAASSRPCAAPARSPSPRRSASSPHGTPPRTSRATSTPRSPTTPCRSSSKSPTPRPRRISLACRKGGWLGPITDPLLEFNPGRYAGPLPDRLELSPAASRDARKLAKAQIIPSLARAPRARTLTLRAFASHPVPSPTDPLPTRSPSRDSRVSTAPSRASTCRTPTATPSSRSPSW